MPYLCHIIRFEHPSVRQKTAKPMFLDSTFNLIGETLIHLTGQPVAPLAGCLTGWMGVFPLGEM